MACPECEAALYCGVQCLCEHSTAHHELCAILSEPLAEKTIDGRKPKSSKSVNKSTAIRAKSQLLLDLLKRNRLNTNPSGFSRGFLDSGQLGMSIEDADRYGAEHNIKNEEEIATVLAMAIISKFLSKYWSIISLKDLGDFKSMQIDGMLFLKQRRNANSKEVRALIKHAKRHIPAATYKVMVAPMPEPAPPPVVVVPDDEPVDLSEHRALLRMLLNSAKSRSLDRLTKILQALDDVLLNHADVSFPEYTREFMEAYNKFKADFRKALNSFEPSDYDDFYEETGRQERFALALFRLSQSMRESDWNAGPNLGQALVRDLLPKTVVVAVRNDYIEFSDANDPKWLIHDIVDHWENLVKNQNLQAMPYIRLRQFFERILANRGKGRAYEYVVE